MFHVLLFRFNEIKYSTKQTIRYVFIENNNIDYYKTSYNNTYYIFHKINELLRFKKNGNAKLILRYLWKKKTLDLKLVLLLIDF